MRGYGRLVLVPELELARLVRAGRATPCTDERCDADAHPRDRATWARLAARFPGAEPELELERAPRHGEP